jgi:outer membrane protein TolC
MRRFSLILFTFFTVSAYSQPLDKLSLGEAFSIAEQYYPFWQQKDLIKENNLLGQQILSNNYLPQLSLSAQATYQSEVTKMPISIPGFTVASASKDQYKVVAELNQLLFDGGVTKQQKELLTLNEKVDQQKTSVELYKLKERIALVYTNILFFNEQLKQISLVQADISIGIKRVESQIANGVSFKSNLYMLQAELMKAKQKGIELTAAKKGWVNALSLYLGKELSATIQLEVPVVAIADSGANDIARPEIDLFNQQKLQVSQQNKLIGAKNLPKASLFGQGGYGRPGLNVLKNEFGFYYIGGVKLNWSLSNLYSKKKEQNQVAIAGKLVDLQKETFVLQTNVQLTQQRAEIEKLVQLIDADKEIISLRTAVTTAAKAQLENGVITASDYLREVNAEDQAKQSLIAHQLQLLQAKINYQIILGK